jgi:ABC-type transport system involved in multi-copper enzyme maturation permease subunit
MTAFEGTFNNFRPFLRKELAEWWQRRAALITFAVVAALGTIGTLATRIDELQGGVPQAGMLDPTANVLAAKFPDWILFAAIFASIGILAQERATGTLAWTLSKPISRSSVLLAKWTAAVIVLATFGLALPLAVSVAVATWAYGAMPDLGSVAAFGLVLAGVPAFFVALNLTVATRLGSQAGIAAIAFAVYAAPYLFGSFLPAIAELWPTSIGLVAASVATGSAPNVASVAGWAAAVLGLVVVGVLVLDREDL